MFSRAPQPRSAPRPWRAAVRRAADLVVAFATLEHPSGPRDHPGEGEGHPHRRPLRAPSSARRPGSVRAKPAVCTVAAGDGPASRPRRPPRRTRHNADEPPVGGSSR